jgi:hypothetical protein
LLCAGQRLRGRDRQRSLDKLALRVRAKPAHGSASIEGSKLGFEGVSDAINGSSHI